MHYNIKEFISFHIKINSSIKGKSISEPKYVVRLSASDIGGQGFKSGCVILDT